MDEKPWYQSKIIWTQIVGTVATAATAGGVVVVSPEVQGLAVTGLMALSTVLLRVFSKPTAIKK